MKKLRMQPVRLPSGGAPPPRRRRRRRGLVPLRSSFMPTSLSRFPNAASLDLSRCPIVGAADLATLPASVLSVDLSVSQGFYLPRLRALLAACSSLTELDMSNRAEFGDREAAAIGEGARDLRVLRMSRWRSVSDFGIGCVAVGFVGLTDLGVGLVAVKCGELRSLDLSSVPITKKCLLVILQLQHLEELSLMRCSYL